MPAEEAKKDAEVDECYFCMADDLIDLRLRGVQEWDEVELMIACEEGAESATYRRVITQLIQELIGIPVDVSQKMRFYNSVKLGLKRLQVDTYLRLDLHGDQNVDDRRYLMEYLIGEVMTNRLLESNLLEKSGEEAMLFKADAQENNMKSCLKNICNVLQYNTSKLGTAILKRLDLTLPDILKGLPAGALTHVLDRNTSTVAPEALQQAWALYNELFTKRRELLLKRFRLTVQSFLWSDKPGLDLASLHNRTEAIGSILSNKPSVSAENVYSLTHLSLFVATCIPVSSTDRKEIMKGEHKLYKLSEVPDRDGRINTYNAEERLAADVERANQQLRGVSGGGGGGGGKGGGKAADWTCPNCSATVFGSKPKCFRCGTTKAGKKVWVAVSPLFLWMSPSRTHTHSLRTGFATTATALYLPQRRTASNATPLVGMPSTLPQTARPGVTRAVETGCKEAKAAAKVAKDSAPLQEGFSSRTVCITLACLCETLMANRPTNTTHTATQHQGYKGYSGK